MSKLIELEYGYTMDSDSKVIYNNKMEVTSTKEYETLCTRNKAYAESYFDSSDNELDELDKAGQLLQVFSNETEDGGQAYYVSEPISFEPLDTYQFFREQIMFGKASKVQYREIDLNEVIGKYRKYRTEDEYLALQANVLKRYNISEEDINLATLKEYMGYMYKHVKLLENDILITLKFNGENELTGFKAETHSVKKQGFSRGR